MASKSTWREDLGPKRKIYAHLGVKEYWLYDPTGEYLTPVLRGIRLAGSVYVRQLAVPSPDGGLTLTSETLGLELHTKGGEMRFRDPETGQIFLSYQEEAAARREAEFRAEQESVARRDAEARVTELEALLRDHRG